MSFSEWKKYCLADIIDIKHGFAFKGEFFSQTPTKDILLSPGNFKIGGGFKSDKTKYFNGNYPADYILSEGDVIVTMTDLSKEGDTLGYSAKVPKPENLNYLHNQRLGLLQFKNKEFDKDFIYWLLRTKEYQLFVVNGATGTTVKHTSPSRIKEYEFRAPDLKSQKRIASILSSLDDAIELNFQINKTLEEMAKALFREWFVDFNFPNTTGTFQETELGKIPVGWKVGKVGDVCEVNKHSLNKKTDKLNWIDYIEISEVYKGLIGKVSRYNLGEEPSRAKRKLKHGDTVLSTVRPDRGAYFLAINPKETDIVSTGFAVFSVTKVPFSYLHLFLTNEVSFKYYGQVANGGAYPAINPNTIMEMDLIIPDKEILNCFHVIVEPFFIQIQQNIEENQSLSNLRDTLLPKLMKGEIKING